MSISLNANFELLSAGLYLDARQQFNTIIEMKDFAETSIPDGFITYNKETQKHYVFNSSNTVDATLGKWREYNRGGGSSEKQIKDWVSGSSYLEGDYIYHEGELYRCLVTNNNVDFNETNWEQLTYGIDELTKEDVEGLLGLTKEEIEAMVDLILDTEVRMDKTYSSSKIYTDIQQCLEDSKTYTLLELGKFSGVGYKIVASTSEMTSESIIYLLANGSTYDMYIVEENGATTKIGDMNVNLSQYYTKTEIDNDFLKKVNADGKYATITAVDGKVDKNNIVTALNNTVTDNQVASALLTKTELDKTNAKLTQLETKQINKTSMVDMYPENICYKITPKDSNSFSKILVVDLYGGCVLITGSIVPNYKSLKVVRLSNGCWESYSASNNVANKIESVYHDGSYIYVNCLTYMKINFEGGFTNVEKIDSLPSNVTQLPILDLTQEADLSAINSKLTQLENTINKVGGAGGENVYKGKYVGDLNDIPFIKSGVVYKYDIRSGNCTNTPVDLHGILYSTYFDNDNYCLQEFHCLQTNKASIYRRDKGARVWSDWKELATMDKLNYSTVADVSKTLTPLFPSVVKVASGGVTINYVVRNGWCNVNFKFNITSSTTFSWTDIAWGLPIPANSIDTVLMSDGKATQPIPIKITSTGSVSSKVLSAISTTDWWTGNISYPVAE